ncbi:hypothetical protein BKA70DRAFT_171899 [Coprinopsis sp. MPI-PUGE-AT-0042]|nr:hypothetical protein BKA70DRAFT_171899 [Coprinopsis sp. MPI-PUGE-AT-0042]
MHSVARHTQQVAQKPASEGHSVPKSIASARPATSNLPPRPPQISGSRPGQIGRHKHRHRGGEAPLAYVDEGIGLPSPRTSFDSPQAKPSALPELSDEEQDHNIASRTPSPSTDHDDEEEHLLALDDDDSLVRIDLDTHPTHQASVTVTSPRTTRFECTKCGLKFRHEYDEKASILSEVKSLSRSLRSSSDLSHSHHSPESDEDNEDDGFALEDLAFQFQSSRTLMEMTRFQLKLALAIFMNRLAEFEAVESLVHSILHSTSKEDLQLWHAHSSVTEEVLIQDLPTVALELGDNLSLLRPYARNLLAVKSFDDMRELESRVDGLFVKVDRKGKGSTIVSRRNS